MNLNDLYTEEKVRLDPKCWTGKKIGNPKTKMKGGTRVNNCVPAESVNEMDKSQTPPGRDGSNDSDAGKKEYTAKPTTAKKVAKDGEKILNKELNKKQGVAEGLSADDSVNYTMDHPIDKEYVYSVYRNGKKEGTYHSVTQANQVLAGLRKTYYTKKLWDKYKITRSPRSKLAGPVGQLPEQGVAEVSDATKQSYKEKAQAQVRELEPYAKKGEYKDIAQRAIDRRQKGLARVPDEQDKLDEKSTSQAQFRTMAAAAHNPEFAKKVGISRDVAKEFHGADRKQDYTDLPKKADESKSAPKEKEADYGDDYQDMVARVKKLAGLGPLKTVYDPAKRVYRNVPVAQQPDKK